MGNLRKLKRADGQTRSKDSLFLMLAFAFGLGVYPHLFSPGRHDGKNDANHDRRTDPKDSLTLEGFAEFEREIELVPQSGEITREPIPGVGRFLPQFVE